MLQNAYFVAKIGADTAEKEQHFAEILPKTGNYPTGPPGRLGVYEDRQIFRALQELAARAPPPAIINAKYAPPRVAILDRAALSREKC